MLEQILHLLISLAGSLVAALLLLRAWAQHARLPFSHPLLRSIVQLTNWAVLPLRRFIPGVGGIDWACVVGAWIAAFLFTVLLAAIQGAGSAMLLSPILLLSSLVTLAKWTLDLLLWVTLLMVLLSWISPRADIMPLLQQLVGPVLAPLRRFLPTPGGIDLSPLVLLVGIQIGHIVLGGLSVMAVRSLG